MLTEEIKKRAMEAMKAGRTVEKNVLRLALGEIQTAEARDGSVTDEQAQALIRRIIKANDETAALSGDEQKAVLAEETAVLKSLLPQTLDVDAIAAALAPVRDALRAAANEGQATGIAMKHLKASGATVNGKDVTEAARRLRA